MNILCTLEEVNGVVFDWCRGKRKKIRSKSEKYAVKKTTHDEFSSDNDDYQ